MIKRYIGLTVVIVHLVLIFGYISPVNAILGVWKYWSVRYCYPFLDLRVNLFTPVSNSYARWFVEKEDCTWEPVKFVEQDGSYISMRLQERLSDFLCFKKLESIRNDQLRISCPKADSFKIVRYYYDGNSDTSFFVIPKEI